MLTFSKLLRRALFIYMNKKESHIELENETGNRFECDELDEIVHLSILYDFYGDMLSEHKKQIFEDYILNDLSLSEIAKEKGISRQGVYDIVKRCSRELQDYEDRLSLISRFRLIKEKLSKIKTIAYIIEKEGDMSPIKEIETLADDILKEL